MIWSLGFICCELSCRFLSIFSSIWCFLSFQQWWFRLFGTVAQLLLENDFRVFMLFSTVFIRLECLYAYLPLIILTKLGLPTFYELPLILWCWPPDSDWISGLWSVCYFSNVLLKSPCMLNLDCIMMTFVGMWWLWLRLGFFVIIMLSSIICALSRLWMLFAFWSFMMITRKFQILNISSFPVLFHSSLED